MPTNAPDKKHSTSTFANRSAGRAFVLRTQREVQAPGRPRPDYKIQTASAATTATQSGRLRSGYAQSKTNPPQ